MRQSFANLLAAPFVGGALFYLYLAWKDSDHAPKIVPFVLIAALIWVFTPQINWWWYSRNPPALPDGLRALLERGSFFYHRLDAAGQKRFRDRTALFMMGTEWMPMGWPDEAVPPDIQLALSVQAVSLTLKRPKLLFDNFEKVIVYPLPFPSPEHDVVHASELYQQDGCLLFSAEQLMPAFLQPGTLYNIGLHEYAKAFVLTYPKEIYPDLSGENTWANLEAISNMPLTHIESVIGLPVTDPLPVAIHHYITFPERFRNLLPEAAHVLDGIF
ncbi:MAG: zinc-dependent peptidase [Saprospiraceae bacterium]